MRSFLVLLILLCTRPAAAEDLNANQINNQLIGQSLKWWNSSGWDAGWMQLLPGGKAMITVETPRQQRDVGRWFVRGNEVCTTWSALREKMQKCYSLQEVEPGHFVSSGGNEFRVISAGA